MTRTQFIQKGVDMSDTEKAKKTMAQEIEYLRKRVSGLEAEDQDLRLNPIGKEKDDWFRKLVEIMNDGVVVLSKDASIAYCNNRMLELIDRSAGGSPGSVCL